MSATERQREARPWGTARVTTVGSSHSDVCGVRAFDLVLREALTRQGIECSSEWEEIPHALPVRERGRRFRDLGRRTGLRSDDGWTVWHYSVFGPAQRGVPIFVPGLVVRLRGARPLCVVLHELFVPWSWRPGVKARAVALAQRLALLPILWIADAVVVTEEVRRDWLQHAWFLPRRAVLVSPVPSPLPVDDDPAAPSAGRIGVTGYTLDIADAPLVASAVRQIRDRGHDASVLMLGAPGPDTDRGTRWRRACERERVPISFTGVVPLDELARAHRSCQVILQPESIGPSPRRTSFASAIASGRPVVAFNGEQTWSEVESTRAALLVPQVSELLAAAMVTLMEDPIASAEQAERGRHLYESRCAPDVVAAQLVEFLDDVGSRR